MTCDEKLKELMNAGDKLAELLSGLPEVEQWNAAKQKVTEPPSAPTDPNEEWGS